jgi:hypothetical protein
VAGHLGLTWVRVIVPDKRYSWEDAVQWVLSNKSELEIRMVPCPRYRGKDLPAKELM